MKIFKVTLILYLMASMSMLYARQSPQKDQKMKWFADAKLGIFIHWGIYAVNGISESWSFYNNYINHEAYMKQLDGFNAAKYQPQSWVKLIRESGATYAIITAKHHDGVALWDTKAPKAISTSRQSAAKKDLIGPFVKALRTTGLKTGIYFSLPDWSYPDYDIFTRDIKRYDIKTSPERWNSFRDYMQTQLQELSSQYHPDLFWFDGDWEHSAQEWQSEKIRQLLLQENPQVIINSRLDQHGDYDTPEQGVPVLKPQSPYWELCYTMNDSWGYQPYDRHYKSSNMIIRTLVDCISMGGNLLLDIGPRADGTIAPEQVTILKDLGRWTSKHSAAIYGTRAGIPEGHVNAKTSLSADQRTLFIYLENKDLNGIRLNGIASPIKKATVLGTNVSPGLTLTGNMEYLLRIPQNAFDQDVTVIKLEFNEPVSLKPEPHKPLTLTDLFLGDKNAAAVSYRLKSLSDELNKGFNLFNQTQLRADGLHFSSGIPGSDPTVEDWVIKHAEALYHTQKGIPPGHYQGNTVCSADRQTLYLFVEGKPNGPIAIKGLKNHISRIRIVGEGTILPHEVFNQLYWSKIPGIVYIPIPPEKLDQRLTVIAVLLDGPVDLYREKVGAIESNL